MLAHGQGTLLNTARLAQALAVSAPMAGRYIDLLVDLLLVRRLAPWSGNLGKRLVRSPKRYVRDSGLVHALLDIGTGDQLLGHSPCDPPAHLNMCALFNDVGYLSLMAPCPPGVATGDEVPGLLVA